MKLRSRFCCLEGKKRHKLICPKVWVHKESQRNSQWREVKVGSGWTLYLASEGEALDGRAVDVRSHVRILLRGVLRSQIFIIVCVEKTRNRSLFEFQAKLCTERAGSRGCHTHDQCWWSHRSYAGRPSSWSYPGPSWSARTGCWERSGSWFSTVPCRWGTRWFCHLLQPMPVNHTASIATMRKWAVNHNHEMIRWSYLNLIWQ